MHVRIYRTVIMLLVRLKQALNACFRSFEFDEPRAKICCDIGKYFLDREQYNQAIFWYELALTRKINETSGGFNIIGLL